MELDQFPSSTFLFACLLLLIAVLELVKASKVKGTAPNLPPGPWKLPLIGNLHQIISGLPHHTFTEMAKKYGPLIYLQLGQVPTIIVSSPQIAREIMKTHDVVFAQRPCILASRIISYNSAGIIFSRYGDYWKQLRRICTMEVFSPKRVESFRYIREEEVADLIKMISLNEGSVINLSDKIFSLTYAITSRAAFGGKCKDQQVLVSIIRKLTELASGFCLSDMYPSSKALELISGLRLKLEKLHKETDRILESILSEHKQRILNRTETEEGLVDVLVKFQLHDHDDIHFTLTDDNIKAAILDIFAAGSETSSTVVEWAMSELLKNPRLMEKAQTEIRQVFDAKGYVNETELHELKFLYSIMKETLRLHPPAPLLLPREATESCVINGYDIPAKTRVIVNGWAIGRDPNYWKDPEVFYPERFLDTSIDYNGRDFEYIPFGAGRRICPGILLSLPNVMLPLAQLLYHFDWKIAGGTKEQDLDMAEKFGLTVRRKNDLLLIPTLYHLLNVGLDSEKK